MINPAKIKFYRNLLRLSQNDFAKLINRNKAMVSEWETGVHQPRTEGIKLLETVFKRELEKHGKECMKALETFNLEA